MSRLIFLMFAVTFTTGCMGHIGPYVPKKRDFETGEYADSHRARGASLFVSGSRGLFEDDRASRVGDVVIIQLDENDTATHDATTNMSKKSSMSLGLSGGLIDALQKVMPAVALTKLLGIDAASDFAGAGSVKRGGKLQGSVPVRVRKVLPNDDLYVEGTKVVMVGNEEHHLYISGIVRPVDVKADGTVPSSRVADAEIEYTGRGDISDYQRPGWLTRYINKASPF